MLVVEWCCLMAGTRRMRRESVKTCEAIFAMTSGESSSKKTKCRDGVMTNPEDRNVPL